MEGKTSAIVLSMLVSLSVCMTRNSEYDLHNVLFANYSSEIRPVDDQNDKLTINVSAFLSAIVELDEPSGQLTTNMGFILTWTDIGLAWDPMDFEGRTRTFVGYNKIWTPTVFLVNPSRDLERLGELDRKVAIDSKGTVTWSAGGILYSICNVDVTFFPYDEQICVMKFNSFEYGPLIEYEILSPTLDLTFFGENGVWSLEKTDVTIDTTSTFTLQCTLYLTRRSTFSQLNIMVPIMLLVFLNIAVFLLPPESGERIGFAVTILLSISVYMTIVTDRLPNTSKPVSMLNYILVIFLAQSAVICIKTVVGLRLYAKGDKKLTSPLLLCFVKAMKCKCRNKRKVQIDSDHSSEEVNGDPQFRLKEAKFNEEEPLTWKALAESFDTFSLCFNLVITVVVALIFMAVVVIVKPEH